MSDAFGSAIPGSLALFQRAVRVIPGGIYGHTSPAAGLPGIFPYFAARGTGCRYWDVDGREILDFMCGFGPLILGYRHPEVEAAAEAERQKGMVFNHPTDKLVELAEALVERIDFADWAVFGKNGSDMTTWAVQVAREATGRSRVARVKGAYHGVDAWCTPGHGGLIPEDRSQVDCFDWNRLESLDAILDSHPGEVAAVILTPYHHPSYGKSILPAPGFMEGVQARCRRAGMVFILDDIRAGFRLHAGGSHRFFGFEPDLACYCKALANGYALSAAVGRDSLREAAVRVFLTGSYWQQAEAMAASLACLRIIEEQAVPERLRRMGTLLAVGLAESAGKHGFEMEVTGPPAMPFPVFVGDPDLFLLQRFCALVMEEGVFFHPHHNWFLGVAHGEEEIAQAVAAADLALAKLSKEQTDPAIRRGETAAGRRRENGLAE